MGSSERTVRAGAPWQRRESRRDRVGSLTQTIDRDALGRVERNARVAIAGQDARRERRVSEIAADQARRIAEMVFGTDADHPMRGKLRVGMYVGGR
ncbi:MAG TPA: hypothetical protein RMH99_00420 [Sandaracinaceae bacterium LLY-WYZ-13_1]|nr:hypothetical protein [Sandaracinaceae bacterium LLY-WYZ-13_1]